MSLYYLWYVMGYDVEDEIQPDPKTLHVRHELLKQVKLSNYKLRSTAQLPHGLEIPVLRRETNADYDIPRQLNRVFELGNRPP